jgi:hypothetical protein
MKLISGPVLLGFGDLFEETIGATPRKPSQRKPSTTPQKPGAAPARIYPAPARSQVTKQHGQVLRRAQTTLAQAARAAKAAIRVATPKTKIQGDEIDVMLGLVDKPLTPKQTMAVAKHKKAQASAGQAGQIARAAGQKAIKAAQNLAQATLRQKAVADRLRGKRSGRRPTRIRGLLADPVIGASVAAMLDDYYAQVGAEPDPQNPGALTDGNPDPAFAQAEGAEGGTGGAPPTDVLDNADSLPPPPPMSTFIPDMDLVGGILYDGSRGTPDGFCGSYGLMSRATDDPSGVPKTAGIDPVYHYGYVFGRYWDKGNERGIPFGDNLASNRWNHVKGRWILGDFRDSAAVHRSDGAAVVDLSEALKSPQTNSPKGVPYGPLVGNPTMPEFKGLRVDGQGRMFFLPQEAPDWLTFPLKQASALTAKKEQEAAAAAAKAEAAAAAKAQADAQAQKAQQDAANALAESQAASEAKQAESKAQGQQIAQETQASQILLQQAQAEAEQNRQAGEILLQQARQQAEWQARQAQRAPATMGPDPGYDPGYDPDPDDSGGEFDDADEASEQGT